MTELYDELGVGPDASPDEIKAAHRRGVRQHHPDVGGDPDRFHAIQRAYNVLSDHTRRSEYDRTGRVDESDPIARQKAQAMQVAGQAVLGILGDPHLDLARMDVVGVARDRIAAMRRGIEEKMESLRLGRERLQEFLRRLKRKEETGVDHLRAMADVQVQQLDSQILATEDELKVVSQARELVEEYVYNYDRTPPGSQWVNLGAVNRGSYINPGIV